MKPQNNTFISGKQLFAFQFELPLNQFLEGLGIKEL